MAFVATQLGIDYKVCCNGYMGRLRTTRVRYRGWLWTTKIAFVLTFVGFLSIFPVLDLRAGFGFQLLQFLIFAYMLLL